MQDVASEIELDEKDRQHVRNALECILTTERFEASPQMSAFLRYVVEQSIDGKQNRIKAFTVAVDALGKPSSFDPQNDPLVRVMAGRLRAALSAYNLENPASPVMITMTKGSYVPTFRRGKNLTAILSSGLSEHEPLADLEIARSSSISPLSPTHELPRTDEIALTSSSDSSTTKAETSNDGAHHTKQEKQSPASITPPKGPHSAAIHRLAVVAVVIALIAVSYVVNHSANNSTPQMQAAAPLNNIAIRIRPNIPSVFVSAIDQGDPWQNSLNTLVSSVISENSDLNVHRIMDQQPTFNFWPEDYILTLASLNLPNETRVDLQLMEAMTGRIVHSQALILSGQASEQVSRAELTELIEATQSLVMEKGPLFIHYANKHSRAH